MTRRVSTGGSRTHMKNMMQKQQMEQDEQRRRDLSISSPASSLDSSASSLDSSGIHNSHHSVNTFNQGSFDGGFSNSHHANFGNIPHSHSSGHLGGAHSFTDASLTRSNFMQTGGHDSFGGTSVGQTFQPYSQPHHEAESLLTQSGAYPISSHAPLTHTQSNPTLYSRSVSPSPALHTDVTNSSSLPQKSDFSGNMEFLTGPNQFSRSLPPASSEESISDSQFSDEGQYHLDHAISNPPYSFFPSQGSILIEQPLSTEHFDRQLFYPPGPNGLMQNIQISRSHPGSGFGMPIPGGVKKSDDFEFVGDPGIMGYPEAKEVRTQVKERRKKDNHNAIERRRRYHINERITDLLALLPSHEDMKPHKGKILEASVDYIKQLQGEKKYLEDRVKELELILTQNNISYRRQSIDTGSVSSRGPSPAPSPVGSNYSSDAPKSTGTGGSQQDPFVFGAPKNDMGSNLSHGNHKLPESRFQQLTIDSTNNIKMENPPYYTNWSTNNNLINHSDAYGIRLRTDTDSTIKGRDRSDTDVTMIADFESSMEQTLKV